MRRVVKETDAMVLIDALVNGADGRVEAQEKRGQASFVASQTLPTDFGRGDAIDTKLLLVEAGVKFLGPVEGDPLFQFVELPVGWSKRPTDHDMWSDLIDGNGQTVAAIFYKAAFYDRRASLSLDRNWIAMLLPGAPPQP